MAALLVAIVLPFAVATIPLGSESERGLLWKNLNAMACDDDIKSLLYIGLVLIDKDLSTINGVLAYANAYIAILEAHQIPNPQGHFLVLLLCLLRENKIVIAEEELIDPKDKNIVNTNELAMFSSIVKLLANLYENNENIDLQTINIIAHRSVNEHRGDNWQDRDYDPRFAHAQTITNTILRQLVGYRDLSVAGVRVHADIQFNIPSGFELLVRVLVTFYGIETQLTAIRRTLYAHEHGAQGVFPAANEISPFFIGNTPP